MSAATRSELAEQLRQLGVETVTADYDGSGDSGQIEEPEFGSSKVSRDLAIAVQDLFYDVLEEQYGGWEINEGSFGQFSWDIKADRINLVHNMRIEETETEEQTL
jgi:hypothetical protein